MAGIGVALPGAVTGIVQRRGVFAFVAVWALFALAASIWLQVIPGGAPAFHLDLRVFRAGAEAYLHGVPLYDAPLDVGGGREMPFTYPPIAAILFIPLTWMSVGAAGVVWTLLCYAALTGVLYTVARWAGRPRRAAGWIALLGMCLATALTPVWTALNLGQIGIFLMLLVVVDLLAPGSRRPRGLLVGVAAAIKLTPAGFLLLPLLRKDWATAVWIAVGALGLTALGALLAWSDSVVYWSTLGQASDRVVVFSGAANISFAGIVPRVAHGTLGAALLIVCDAIAIILAIIAMRRQLSTGDVATALMVNAIVLLLVSPVSWDHHWVWAAPIIALLALASIREPIRFGPLFIVTAMVFAVDPGIPGSWMRWVLWGVMYCVLLVGVRPDPRTDVTHPG
jgi:alpha-1,2-mannosyltransferase